MLRLYPIAENLAIAKLRLPAKLSTHDFLLTIVGIYAVVLAVVLPYQFHRHACRPDAVAS